MDRIRRNGGLYVFHASTAFNNISVISQRKEFRQRSPEYLGKTTDLLHVTDTLSPEVVQNIPLYIIESNLQICLHLQRQIYSTTICFLSQWSQQEKQLVDLIKHFTHKIYIGFDTFTVLKIHILYTTHKEISFKQIFKVEFLLIQIYVKHHSNYIIVIRISQIIH